MSRNRTPWSRLRRRMLVNVACPRRVSSEARRPPFSPSTEYLPLVLPVAGQEAEGLAGEIIKNAPLALSWAIEAINRALDKTLDDGLELEAEIFGRTCASQDFLEGARAFLEKRKPNFRGR